MCFKTNYPNFSPVFPFAVLLPVLWIGSSSVFSDEHSTSDKSGSAGQRQWGRRTMKEQWTDGHWWRGGRWTGLNVCVCVLFYCYTHAICSTKQLLTPEPLFLHLHWPVQVFVRGIYFFYMRKNMQRLYCTEQDGYFECIQTLYWTIMWMVELKIWDYVNRTLSTSCIFSSRFVIKVQQNTAPQIK